MATAHKFLGCDQLDTLELAVKIGDIGESIGIRRFGYGNIFFHQQFAGIFNPQFVEKKKKRFPRPQFKKAAESIGRHAGYLRLITPGDMRTDSLGCQLKLFIVH